MKIITVLAACLAAATPPLAAVGGRVLPWPDLPPQAPDAKQVAPQKAHWQPELQQAEPQREDATPRRNLYQWPPPAPESGWLPPVGMGTPTTDGAKTYRVTAGDTLYRVMRKTGMPIKKLASLNKLAGPPYQIRKGQVLRLE